MNGGDKTSGLGDRLAENCENGISVDHDMLGVRRSSLVRQMAFRQDSNESELSVRHGHLAPPSVPPDSPRPQKDIKSG
uniref:Uncharacterized protein n=1 Tax=Heterorhabditis bacteriophora TaxID=37862 RepID=A0A1I7WVS8_HETBA